MLVIRRRLGESVLIGPDIEIEILDAGINKVKLGIVGPRSIQVVRKEVKLAAETNLSAALISVELKDLIVKKLSQLPQTPRDASDKSNESGYSGHPLRKENPDPT